MTKIQQVERKLRKKIERLMEREGVILVQRESYGTFSQFGTLLYEPCNDCGVCALGAAVIGTKVDTGWVDQDAARVLGITYEEAVAINCGFEGYLVPTDSPYYDLGDRLRRDYCVEEQQ